MKSAKIFLTGMYVHLILSIGVPIAVFLIASRGWNAPAAALFAFYLLTVGAVHLLGWVSAGLAVSAYHKKEYDKIWNGWKLLKLRSIPFYLVNFIYSFLVWFTLVGASRGILVLLVPIPVFVTCSMVVQSGIYGICVILALRKMPEYGGRPAAVHYVLQLVSVLDLISTVIIQKKYPLQSPARGTAEQWNRQTKEE